MRRPILATVINLLVIIAGVAALQGIEVRELPDVDRPVVTVRSSYPGATPESMDAQITAIIESAVSRVQGVTSISSNSSYGSSRVAIEFASGADLQTAAMDVRDAVAGIRNQLPQDMDNEPRVVKADADASPIIRMAVASSKLSETELTDLVNNVVEDRLAAVEGVAAANSYGLRDKTIEVRVSPVALAARGLSLSNLIDAISKASAVTPSGALENATQQLLVRAEAPVSSPEDVSELAITPQTKVGDVSYVRWAFQEATAMTRLDGKAAIGVEIVRQAQANTIAISEGIRAAVDELKRSLPEGVEIAITSDDAIFIRESVREVVIALVLSTIIVVLIIFAFLGSIRATIAPAIAIPVSLIGTIAAIWMAGFSHQHHHAARARRRDRPCRRRRHRRHREHRAASRHGQRSARRRRHRDTGDRVRGAGDHSDARRRVHSGVVHAGHRRRTVFRVRVRARVLGHDFRADGAHDLSDAGGKTRRPGRRSGEVAWHRRPVRKLPRSRLCVDRQHPLETSLAHRARVPSVLRLQAGWRSSRCRRRSRRRKTAASCR